MTCPCCVPDAQGPVCEGCLTHYQARVEAQSRHALELRKLNDLHAAYHEVSRPAALDKAWNDPLPEPPKKNLLPPP